MPGDQYLQDMIVLSAYLGQNAGLVDDFNGKMTRTSNNKILVYETLQAANSDFQLPLLIMRSRSLPRVGYQLLIPDELSFFNGCLSKWLTSVRGHYES